MDEGTLEKVVSRDVLGRVNRLLGFFLGTGTRSSLLNVPAEELDFLDDIVLNVLDRLTAGDPRLWGEAGRGKAGWDGPALSVSSREACPVLRAR